MREEHGIQWTHFREQWDGVFCPYFDSIPGEPLRIEWNPGSLASVREKYPESPNPEHR